MDPERERLIRQSYESWNRGDLEAILADVHPEIEFRVSGVVPGIPEVAIDDPGGALLVRSHYSGRIKGTEAPVEADYFTVYEYENELFTSMRDYEREEDARAALGRSRHLDQPETARRSSRAGEPDPFFGPEGGS
jgi:hypothetical protein